MKRETNEVPGEPIPEPEPEPTPEPAPEPPPAAVMPPLTPQQMIEMMTAGVTAGVSAAVKAQADPLADAMKRALKPENAFSPLVSVFNPAGDRDHPRPALRVPFTLFDGIPIDGTTETVEELTLFNQLEAGDYLVTKSDGSRVRFTVREIRNDLGVLQRINIAFPYRDEADRQGVMPMVMWLREVVQQIQENKARTLTAA